MAEWFSRAQVHEQLRELGYGEVSEETFEEFYAGKPNATRVKLSFPKIILTLRAKMSTKALSTNTDALQTFASGQRSVRCAIRHTSVHRDDDEQGICSVWHQQ